MSVLLYNRRYRLMNSRLIGSIFIILFLNMTSCMGQMKLFTDATDPFNEFTLQGEEDGKILIIPVKGIISDIAKEGFLKTEPSIVQDIVSQLKIAEEDSEVKAILFKIDSPGGSVTASDILYHEIKTFKERTDIKVMSVMMNVATSGGYYIALPSDYIMAHPTSITGSVGVIFLRPKVFGLMEKIGVDVSVNTSGKNKDMGSPFRETTEAEQKIFQEMTEQLGNRFLELVVAHRKIDPEIFADISSARVYVAKEALKLGLIDEVGYLSQAIEKARELAELPADSKVVIYRRIEFPDDNLYNSQQTRFGGTGFSVIDLGLPDTSMLNRGGFYYLWPAGIDTQ